MSAAECLRRNLDMFQHTLWIAGGWVDVDVSFAVVAPGQVEIVSVRTTVGHRRIQLRAGHHLELEKRAIEVWEAGW